MMFIKVKATAVGHDGVEQDVELRFEVVGLGDSEGQLIGDVGTEHGDVFGSFSFKPAPGFNAWGSPTSVVAKESDNHG